MATDYAMSTKARSFYSKHLTAANYRAMIDSRDVATIASYLKNETRYADVLEGINEKAIHRDFLEQRIRLKAHYEFLALMRYIQISNHHFYEFYVEEVEIQQIIFVLHAIESKTRHFVDNFIRDLNQYTSFDVYKLAESQSFQDMFNVLSGTRYASVLSGLNTGELDILVAEDNLRKYYNQSMIRLIRNESSSELLDLFLLNNELTMVGHIYRMKKYFKMSPDLIIQKIHHEAYYISETTLSKWIYECDADEFLKEFSETPFGRYHEIDFTHQIEYNIDMIRFRILKNKLRFSKDSDVILFAYIFLVRLEMKNIIDVIEGVRYNMNPEEIVKLLIV